MKTILAFVALVFAFSVRTQAQESIYDGEPEFPKSGAAYLVWRSESTWHVRWVSVDRLQRFSGSVTAEGGALASFSKIDADNESQLRYPRRLTVSIGKVNQRPGPVDQFPMRTRLARRIDFKDGKAITFSSELRYGMDGFDFAVDPGATSVKLILEIDGKTRPQSVRLGKSGSPPESLPLLLALK